MKIYASISFGDGLIRYGYILVEIDKNSITKISDRFSFIAKRFVIDPSNQILEEVDFENVNDVIKWKFKGDHYYLDYLWIGSEDQIQEFESDDDAKLWFELEYNL